jgi:hypothetical protein
VSDTRPQPSARADSSAAELLATQPTPSQGETKPHDPASLQAETAPNGGIPPKGPPASTVASSAQEPRRPGGTEPPPFDVEEFVREAEDRKRGAKTVREISALGSSIRQLRERGVPFGAIHRGLQERNLVSCSRSRFDELCAALFPDLIGKARPSDG